jgi:uncharacterized protein (TIGR03032 family)
LLQREAISLLLSTYQAGKLMAVRAAQGVVWTELRSFDRPMGLAARSRGQFVLATQHQVWDFRDAPSLAGRLAPAGQYDACFIPRVSWLTGDILVHEIGWVGDELWLVNTLFSCLCTLHPDFSFVPRWRPPFVTALAPEDRCHLNGLAVVGGQPKYVTALGATDTIEGWRPGKVYGGLLLDVASGQAVAHGLSMPHSPRVHDGRLWVLEGGTGRLLTVDPVSGKNETVAELPGFARGLALYGRYAFVGLSQIREQALFGGLPIGAKAEELRCGLWVVDLQTGRPSEYLQFQAGVEEIFGVEVLAGVRFPEVFGVQGDALYKIYVLPPT